MNEFPRQTPNQETESPKENPAPATEREPRFPSLEEVIAQMKILIGQEDLKEERRKEGEDGVQLYEVSLIENLNGHEITSVYTYRKADGNRVLVTSIDVAYCNGSPDDNDWLPGGYTISEYDELTGEWRKASGIDDAKKRQTAAEKISDPRQKLIAEASRTAKTELPPGGIRELSPEAAERYQALCEMFEAAETAFGETSLEKVLEREAADLESALKARKEAKPLLNEIHLLLVRLNKSSSPVYPLAEWNPHGDFTESQFNELKFRRGGSSPMPLESFIRMLREQWLSDTR